MAPDREYRLPNPLDSPTATKEMGVRPNDHRGVRGEVRRVCDGAGLRSTIRKKASWRDLSRLLASAHLISLCWPPGYMDALITTETWHPVAICRKEKTAK
jgi:hypothetical protein